MKLWAIWRTETFCDLDGNRVSVLELKSWVGVGVGYTHHEGLACIPA